MILFCQLHGIVITAGQQTLLALLSAIPHRANGMNHFFAGKFVGVGHFALTRLAPTKRSAFLNQFRSCRPMNGAIHSTPAEQRPIGRIDNGIHFQRGDISHHDFYFVAIFFHEIIVLSFINFVIYL